MKEISINDIENVQIGQAQDLIGATGVTVIVCKDGAPCGLDVRGGGPASRESELLKSPANAKSIHAVVLGGGSAFGLDAAGGVMACLEEHNIGYDVGITKVPLVCQSDIFDLSVGNKYARPDKKMGYEACLNALSGGNYQDGNFGAGTGATVGKMLGMDYCMKSGIGSYAVSIGDLKVGAIVAVNAIGDIYDESNHQIAGLLNEDKTGLRSSLKEMYKKIDAVENKFTGNTTIGVIMTNGKFDKHQLNKIASMTHNGYARSIKPVHTSADGDSIYALSLGQIEADMDMVGTLASEVMSKAIIKAIQSATSDYGLISYTDLNK